VYAGLVVTTPATLVVPCLVEARTSASPPNSKTVPGSYSLSELYHSAKSAHVAWKVAPISKVNVPCTVAALLPPPAFNIPPEIFKMPPPPVEL